MKFRYSYLMKLKDTFKQSKFKLNLNTRAAWELQDYLNPHDDKSNRMFC